MHFDFSSLYYYPHHTIFATITTDGLVLILRAFSRGTIVSSTCDIFVVSHCVSLYEGDTHLKTMAKAIQLETPSRRKVFPLNPTFLVVAEKKLCHLIEPPYYLITTIGALPQFLVVKPLFVINSYTNNLPPVTSASNVSPSNAMVQCNPCNICQ